MFCSSIRGIFAPCGPLVVVLPVRQLCTLWATTLMHITIAALPLARLLHWFQFTVLPLARLYRISISLQRQHLSDSVALVSVYSRAIGQTLFHCFSVGSPDACQTLFHWFQLAVLPLARFDFPGSVCNLLISIQRFIIRKVTMLFGNVPWAHDLMHTTLQLRHRPEYTSPGPRCDRIGQNLLH